MKFKMNDITYVIKEVSQKEYKELRVIEDEEAQELKSILKESGE